MLVFCVTYVYFQLLIEQQVLGILRCNWDEVANMTGVSVTPVGTYVHIVQGLLSRFTYFCLFCFMELLLCYYNTYMSPKSFISQFFRLFHTTD